MKVMGSVDLVKVMGFVDLVKVTGSVDLVKVMGSAASLVLLDAVRKGPNCCVDTNSCSHAAHAADAYRCARYHVTAISGNCRLYPVSHDELNAIALGHA